jgi:hypothetical protein
MLLENIARIGVELHCEKGSLFSRYPGSKFRKSLLPAIHKMRAKMTDHCPSRNLEIREPLPDLNWGLATGNYPYE